MSKFTRLHINALICAVLAIALALVLLFVGEKCTASMVAGSLTALAFRFEKHDCKEE